jgi:hypothetical protein
MSHRAVALFDSKLPIRPPSWWRGFDLVIAPRATCEAIPAPTVVLEDLLCTWSVQEGAARMESLSRMTLPDGNRVCDLVSYKGFKLWWMHYDEIYHRFMLPYLEYRVLLERLRSFEHIHLIRPPNPALFSYYLDAYNRSYSLEGVKKHPLSWGTIMQLLLTVLSLPWLMLRRAPLMIWTGDHLDTVHAYDLRFHPMYEALHSHRVSFVEFVRSQEPSGKILSNMFRRRRAVIYAHAITTLFHRIASLLAPTPMRLGVDPERRFWLMVATHFTRIVRGDIWSIRTMQLILRCIGVRTAVMTNASSRKFCEAIACKISGIPITGILHGFASKYFNLADFMPGYDGERKLSVDRYGMWSEWWRQYYIRNSDVYTPEQLVVSGPMRPMDRNDTPNESYEGPVRPLFIAEQLADPNEALPYLEELIGSGLPVFIKFRASNDGFERWLKNHRADILKAVPEDRLLRGSMSDAIARCDVTVGSHSTGVLEALMQGKPFVFYSTRKWGDYFDLATEGLTNCYAATPAELIDRVRASRNIEPGTLSALCERFFGDPTKNGSAWVIEEALKHV